MTRLLGAVLVGGRSSRFGSDKARAMLGDRTLADHATAILARHADAVVLVGERLGGLADLPRADLGPLGGIAAALVHGADHGYPHVVTIGCDMPDVSAGTMAALLRRAPAFCANAPVLGHWPSVLGRDMLAYLDTTADRSVRGWARSVGAMPIAVAGPIANVNTPDDLARLAPAIAGTA